MAHSALPGWIGVGIKCALLVSVWAPHCLAQSHDVPPAATIDEDFVAVGSCGSEIVLATPSSARNWSTTCPQGWRCKRISFDRNVQDFYLARTGTKLAVLFEQEGRPRIFDLSVPDRVAATPTHNVPHQRYRLTGPDGDVSVDDHGVSPSDADLLTAEFVVADSLRDALKPACPGAASRWRLFEVTAEPALYAPVLEFAATETAFPTTTGFWREGPPESHDEARWSSTLGDGSGNGKQVLRRMLERYQGIPMETKRALGALYHRNPVRSYPGSWLFEYWTYYPFDTGHFVNHMHDPEHVFVEVDKLGGQVRAVLAAAHAANTPNNLYLVQSDSEPVTLPLFVFVEQGKHATAPDVNRDGIFSPGVDVNMSFESPQVWGVRDVIGQTDSHMRSYESSMTLARDPRDAWASIRFHEYYSEELFPQIRPTYRLEALPVPDGARRPDAAASEEYANYVLQKHADYRDPLNIYKPWVFPVHQVRVGYSNMNFGPLLTIGYVTDVAHLPYLSKVRLPGRIDIEAMFGWSSAEVNERGEAPISLADPGSPDPVDGTKQVETGRTLTYSGPRVQYGIQYERPTSNLFGYFASFYRRYDAFNRVRVNGTASPDSTPYALGAQPVPAAATSLGQFGVFIEVPQLRNLVFFVGPVFTDPGGLSAVFFRAGFSPWRRSRRRASFGF